MTLRGYHRIRSWPDIVQSRLDMPIFYACP